MRPPGDHERDVSSDHRRRLSFGSVAQQYDRYRPSYPAEMVDAVIAYAAPEPGARVLDVGAGTGHATLPFAARGYDVTAIEPDGAMAAVASQRAATAGLSIAILETEFEHARLPEHAFRILISGTAWHWVAPGLRTELAARALEPGGVLAPFWNRVQWRDNPLRPEFDEIYDAVGQEFDAWPRGPMNPAGAFAELKDSREWLEQEFRGDHHFTALDARLYDWRRRYTTEEYIGLLGTHSDHITLPAAARERLFAGVRSSIEAAGGSFELGYQTLLCLARRRAT